MPSYLVANAMRENLSFISKKKYNLSMAFDLKNIPKEPGVYLMKDKMGKVLYIGKAKILQNRVKHYFSPTKEKRMMIPFLMSQVVDIETIVTFSEKDALILENDLIKRHQPKYNLLLKDDKSFIHLMIDQQHPWPRLQLIRYHGKFKTSNLLFGPYTSAFAARQTMNLMAQLFQLRQCSDHELRNRTRPCLLYSIKRCLAPCTQQCSTEKYREEVKRATAFLQGNNKDVIAELKRKMHHAAEVMEYERAGELKNTIRQIVDITGGKPSSIRTKGEDCDVLSLCHQGKYYLISQLIFRKGSLIGANHFRFMDLISTNQEIWESFLLQNYRKTHPLPPEICIPINLRQKKHLENILSTKISQPKKGEKYRFLKLAEKNATALIQKKDEQESMLIDLQELCDLSRYPMNIECFDVSHTSGTDLVACMIKFFNGIRDKKYTRFFKLKRIYKPDDYGALKEVLTRHYSKAKEDDTLPDLVLIDGGKGQLHIALEVFEKLEIASLDVLTLAKEKGRHSKGMHAEKIFLPHKKEPLSLPTHSPMLFLLQKMRDEAHRVVISFHLKRRNKRLLQTQLTTIPGIGPKKSSLLLKNFGSVKQLKKASRKELETIKGLSKKDLTAIKQFQKHAP